MRTSATHVVERNVRWSGAFATEPWEAAWAGEALFFVRRLNPVAQQPGPALTARVQLSPDGIHWVDEGSCLQLAANAELAFVRVERFGGWLRLAGQLPEDQALTVVAYLVLKA